MRKFSSLQSLLIPALLIVLSAGTTAQEPKAQPSGSHPAPQPNRKCVSNVISSERSPHASIAIPKTFEYVGAQQVSLSTTTVAEQHVFVRTGKGKVISELYWVQFEEQLPGSDWKYPYTFEKTALLGERPFDLNVATRKKADWDGVDVNLMVGMLTAKGYELPREFARIRYVYLTDSSKQRELMIIYLKDAAGIAEKNQPSFLEEASAQGARNLKIRFLE